MTMTIWAVVCLVLFLITFLTTRERIQPPPQQKSDIRQDFAALLKNSPWIVMFAMTLVHFCILSFRGGAWYNYFHHYADKAAMYDWLQSLHLTAPALAPGQPPPAASWKRSATSCTATAPTWRIPTWPTCSTASTT